VGTEVGAAIAFGDDALVSSDAFRDAQTHNYQLMNIAHELTKHWPGLCAPLYALIQTAVQTILERMRGTVSLVLASMHDENLLAALAPGATSSEYVKELCGHLKWAPFPDLVKPLADSVEALPAFLNFCVEQFLLHISLIRPIGEESFDRFVRDLEYLCRNGLEAFNCNCAKLLNAHRQFQQLLKLTLGDSDGMQQLAELASQQSDMKTSSSLSPAIPQWFVAHL
uniref:Conserved oligomeric Golgi complex subunit 8 n=1 Tax=Globodera pallida TaxID=36090 RepID=A0A183CTJ7_GLOPA